MQKRGSGLTGGSPDFYRSHRRKEAKAVKLMAKASEALRGTCLYIPRPEKEVWSQHLLSLSRAKRKKSTVTGAG